jgi:adenylyltransferase/sulfurtransferase
MGAVVGVVGTLAATEILKEITGTGESLTGRLLIYDAKGGRFETVNVGWDPDNPLSGRAPSIHDLSAHGEGAAGPACSTPAAAQ